MRGMRKWMRGIGTGYKHEDLSSDPQNPLLGCGRQRLQLQQGRDGRVPGSLWTAGLAYTAAMTRDKAGDGHPRLSSFHPVCYDTCVPPPRTHSQKVRQRDDWLVDNTNCVTWAVPEMRSAIAWFSPILLRLCFYMFTWYMCIQVYVYVCVYMCIYTYIYENQAFLPLLFFYYVTAVNWLSVLKFWSSIFK